MILDRPKLQFPIVILDGPKLLFPIVILEDQKLRSPSVICDGPKLRSKTVLLDRLKLQTTTIIFFHSAVGRWSKFTDICFPFEQFKKEIKKQKLVQNYGPEP